MTSTSKFSRPPGIPAPYAVLVLVSLMALALAAAVAFVVWASYVNSTDRLRQRASAAAQIVAAQIEWLAGSGRQLLDETDRLAGPDPTQPPGDLAAGLRMLTRSLPRHLEIALVDQKGAVVASSDRTLAVGTPLTGLDLAELDKAQDWIISKAIGSGEEPRRFFMARRIERNGAPAGAAVVIVPDEIMANFLSVLELGPDSTVGLFRDDGWLAARYPPAPGPLDLSKYVLFTEELPKAANGAYFAESPVDGQHRLVAYRRVANAPLVAVASASVDYGMQTFWQASWRLGLLLLPFAAGIAGLIAWVTRLLRRDEALRRQLEKAVAQNVMLLSEIHHRVKNNLQTVSSLIQIQPIPPEAKRDLASRIAAMSAVHEMAYRLDDYVDVDLDRYLPVLIENIRQSYGPHRIRTDVARLTVTRDQATPLGLIVNEVLCNAIKHAFPGRDDGEISVSVKAAAGGQAEMTIDDNGVGTSQATPATGIGKRLIQALAEQLDSAYDLTSEPGKGTHFSIRFAARPGN